MVWPRSRQRLQWSEISNPPSFHLSSHTNKPRRKTYSLQALSLTDEGQCGVNGEKGGEGGNWGTTIKAPLAWIKAGRRLPKGYVGGTRPYTNTRERERGWGGLDGKENGMAQFDISKYQKESRARFLFGAVFFIYLFILLVLKQSIDGSEVVPDTWFELSPFGTQPHPRLPRRPLFPPLPISSSDPHLPPLHAFTLPHSVSDVVGHER